ncbi:hypothetical protein NM688_g8688 [Phlebia brevispora]|uniref:Uncharacterized protein n=1 Tax=Phlebia brevispora TaxID=194682 RepID=A0ACC1RQZ5_9APHY|nr:hypothetical protein NM688_g8688 [Phlebia brevispora]
MESSAPSNAAQGNANLAKVARNARTKGGAKAAKNGDVAEKGTKRPVKKATVERLASGDNDIRKRLRPRKPVVYT